MNSQKKVSVALAVYNGQRFIGEQLESLARQTQLPDELIVSDDASTDNTVEIVRAFAARAPFSVRLLRNDDNLGCTRNFDRAIQQCNGAIIFLCDHDDVWYANKIATTVEAFEAHPLAGVATCDADLIDEHSISKKQTFWGEAGFVLGSRKQKLAEGAIYDRSIPIYGPGIAFRASLKPLILPLPTSDPFRLGFQDAFIMWCIVAAGAGGIALIEKPLMGYRRHPHQITRKDAGRSLPRWKGRRLPPSTVLAPLVERLESEAARTFCLNPAMRVAALRHWRWRLSMPSSKVIRFGSVFTELLAGRYHAYSGGIKSALKDLLFVQTT